MSSVLPNEKSPRWRFHAVVWTVFATALVVLELSADRLRPKNATLSIELESPQTNDVFQVFFDLGRGYRGADSMLHDVIAAEGPARLDFSLPSRNLKEVRIDIGQRTEFVDIRRIHYRSRTHNLELSPPEIVTRVPAGKTHDIANVALAADLVRFETSGNDPFFFLHLEQTDRFHPTTPPLELADLAQGHAAPPDPKRSPRSLSTEVSQRASQQEIRIFFDIGNGLRHEDSSVAVVPPGSGFQRIHVELPGQPLRTLRIDLDASPGETILRSLELTGGGGVQAWAPQEIEVACPPSLRHDISTLRPEDDELRILSIGDDPHFYLWFEKE